MKCFGIGILEWLQALIFETYTSNWFGDFKSSCENPNASNVQSAAS